MKQKLLNKLWLRVGMIVAIMTTALSGTVWADEASFAPSNFSGQGTSGTGSAISATVDGVTFACNKGYGTTQIRCYSGSKITISSSNTITAISFTFSGSSTGGLETSYTSLSTKSWEKTLSSQARITAINVTYTSGGGGDTPVTYTVTFDAGEGTFVGNDAFPNVSNTKAAGSYTLPSATRDGYTFDGWTATGITDPVTGNYTVSGNVDFTASYSQNGSGSGETITFDFEDDTAHRTSGSNSYSSNTYSENGVNISLTYADAVTSGTPLNGSANVMGRIAKNTTNSPVVLIGPIDISSKIITSIAYKTKGVSAMSQVLEYSLNNIDWTTLLSLAEMPTQATTETAANLSITGTKLYLRWTTSVSVSTGSARDFQLDDVVITYTNDGTPSISASDVNIGYDAESGTITYTLENEVIGGALTAAITAGNTGNWLSVDNPSNSNASGTVAFTCSANTGEARTATVTLTYTYNTNESVTKEVTVTQAAAPVIYTTIPALFEAATNTETNVNVTFNNWVVSGVHNNNVFLTDNLGNGLIIYTSNHGFEVNDKLSGTVSETPLKLYNGFAEFTNLTASTTGLTVTKDGEITVITNKTIADLGGVNTGAVITLSNLTYDGTNLSDGTNTIKPYNSLYGEMSLTSGKTYNITGVYQQFNTNSGNTKEILPRSAADIVEVVDEREDAEIAFSVETLTFTEGDTYTAPTFSNPNNVTVSFETTDSDVASWNNGLVLGGSTGTATITATFDGDASYKPAAATLVVTINEDLGFATVKVGSGVYQKITSTSELEAGKRYLIVYWDGTSDDAEVFGGVTSSNIGARVTLSIAEKKINNNVADAATPVVLQNAGLGNWYIMDGDEFLYWSSGNNLYSSTEVSQTGNRWTIDEDVSGMYIQNATTTARYLQYNTGSPRFACYTGSQKNVVLYKELPVTLNGYGYATFSSNYAVSIPADGAFTAWQITDIDSDSDNKITFVQVTGNVKAETGLFLKGTASDEITIEVAASGEELKDNKLVGFPNATNVADNEYYGLSGNQFVKVTAGTVKAGKALLPAGYITESNGVKPFTFIFEDDATGIEETLSNSPLKGENIYNLAGQMVNGKSVNGKLPKGIYIVNGKKILK